MEMLLEAYDCTHCVQELHNEITNIKNKLSKNIQTT